MSNRNNVCVLIRCKVLYYFNGLNKRFCFSARPINLSTDLDQTPFGTRLEYFGY